jgi:hypothetical protein
MFYAESYRSQGVFGFYCCFIGIFSGILCFQQAYDEEFPLWGYKYKTDSQDQQ